MKKTIIGITIAAAIIGAVAGAFFLSKPDIAYAQSDWQETPEPGDGLGHGRMGWARGILHDSLVAFFAESLGISVDDLNARLESGERMLDIAIDEGLALDEFRTLMTDARSQAIQQALEDGTLTEEQAEWMQQRGGGRGMHGGGQDGCPSYQTTP